MAVDSKFTFLERFYETRGTDRPKINCSSLFPSGGSLSLSVSLSTDKQFYTPSPQAIPHSPSRTNWDRFFTAQTLGFLFDPTCPWPVAEADGHTFPPGCQEWDPLQTSQQQQLTPSHNIIAFTLWPRLGSIIVYIALQEFTLCCAFPL